VEDRGEDWGIILVKVNDEERLKAKVHIENIHELFWKVWKEAENMIKMI